MPSDFILPELGENVESGVIARIVVSEGDELQKDQTIMELETDKAVLEIPSDVSGKIARILVSEGEEVKVGQKILVVDQESETAKKEDKPAAENFRREEKEKQTKAEKESDARPSGGGTATKAEKTAAEGQKSAAAGQPKGGKGELIEVRLPELEEGVESGTVVKVLVAEGDTIKKNQNILELETDKAVFELPAEVEGAIREILVKEGEEVKVGQKIMIIAAQEAEKETPAELEEEIPKAEEASEEKGPTETEEERMPPKVSSTTPVEVAEQPLRKVPAAPSVRRFAREIGIDITTVSGSGPGGRISIEDVKAHAKKLNEQRIAGPAAVKDISAEPLPDFSKWGDVERRPMSSVRKKTATHLSYAWNSIPHVTQFDKADITRLEQLRKQHGKKAEEAGGKLTVTAILLKIIAAALKVFPQFNASIDMENGEIIYKKYYHIGVAVDTDRGLLVPVIRDVDQKTILDLSVELTETARKARDRKLTLEEMQGGNFSISNLGGIGGIAFTPVVNSPEVAILGVSRARREQVYVNGQFEPRFMLPLSLSYDHRLIDGADAARFLRWVVDAVEEPFLILLGG